MTIERSKGKARPTLPRSSDLARVETVPDPSDGRGPAGRFTKGNRLSVRAGEKHAAKKLLGSDATDADAALVARDAARLFGGALRDLPSDGAQVRTLVGLHARHAAVSAFYTAKADAAGLATPEGIAFADLALKHGVRVERLIVTANDVSTSLAVAAPRVPYDVEARFHAAEQRLKQHQAEQANGLGTGEDAAPEESDEQHEHEHTDEVVHSEHDEQPVDRRRASSAAESANQAPPHVRIPAIPPLHPHAAAAAAEQAEVRRLQYAARDRDRLGAPLMPTRQKWDGRQWVDDGRARKS